MKLVTGEKSMWYNEINENSIAFSNKGDIAYSVTLYDKHANIYNGQAGNFYDEVGFPVMSASGKRFGYHATNGSKSFAVIDNKEGPAYDNVASLSFSADDKHYAYEAKKGQYYLVNNNGKESDKYEFVQRQFLRLDVALT